MVYTAFTTIHALGICNFLCDDLPELARFIPEEEARSHYLSSAQGIFDMLHHAEIHFTQPDEVVLAAIQILYLSIIHINRIGPNFFPALRLLDRGRMRGAGGVTAKPRSSPDGLIRALRRARRQTHPPDGSGRKAGGTDRPILSSRASKKRFSIFPSRSRRSS